MRKTHNKNDVDVSSMGQRNKASKDPTPLSFFGMMYNLASAVWIGIFLGLCEGFSISEEGNVLTKDSSRRQLFHQLFRSTVVSINGIAAVSPAYAACLMGDTSEDCIGMYKMPLDDEVLPFVDTAEKLTKFAPGIRWVPPVEYPKTYLDARTEMLSLRDSVSSLSDVVLKGQLVEAGSLLLGIIPRVTVTGRVMIQVLEDTKGKKEDLSLRAMRLASAHTELLGILGQCDIIFGQALSGQLGSTTFAQIQILAELREANTVFDELIRAFPESFVGQQK